MKKSINNFKDMIQNKVSSATRNDRTDYIFPYMLNEEKHIENIKQTLISAEKKISNSLISAAQESSVFKDKASRRPPSSAISSAFETAGGSLSETKSESVLGLMLKECSQFSNESSELLTDFESDVSRTCLEHIKDYGTKLRELNDKKKQVVKQHSNLKALQSKYDSSVKASQSSIGQNSIAENKTENLKSELEDCEQKLRQNRDVYEIEMLEFLSKEPDIARVFYDYVKIQATYHENMLKKIHDYLPRLEDIVSTTPHRPVFGVELSEHLHASCRKISLVFDFCIKNLWKAKEEEGLFRLSGSSSKVKILRNALDSGHFDVVVKNHNLGYEFHVFAGVIKSYLRDLPVPLLTIHLIPDWMRVASLGEQERLQEMWSVVNKMPEDYKANLCFLIKFLQELTKNSAVNKMSSQNLAIAIGPSLLWSKDDESMDINMTNYSPVIIESLISYCDYFFPEGKLPSLLYEEKRKEFEYYASQDSPNDSNSESAKTSPLNLSKESDSFENLDRSTGMKFKHKFSSVRLKPSKSPTKELSINVFPNSSPTATIRTNFQSSPRFGHKDVRPRSICERPAVPPPQLPSRPDPGEIRQQRRTMYIPTHNSSSDDDAIDHSTFKPLYPSLKAEIKEDGEEIIIPQNLSTFTTSASSASSHDTPPQKPPRSTVTNVQTVDSPIPEKTHL